MTAALSPALAPDVRPIVDDEPVALLQLCVTGHDWALADAASAVYREIRRGRRVVAVASGAPDAADQLARRLDEIGVDVTIPRDGEALATAEVSVVAGPEHARSQPRPAARRVVRVALAGRGVVGGGLLPRLAEDPRFELVGVLVRNPGCARDVEVLPQLIVTDGAALLAREPDILIEAISDASTGLALMRAAVARGIHVISASKQAIAADLPGLTALAEVNSAHLAYSAAVGGGAPIIETVKRARAHGEISTLEGVLNGTCNFILDRMESGIALEEALAKAQMAGFAEADPSADLNGLDAAAKLAILAWTVGFRLPVDKISRQPLEPQRVTRGMRQLASLDAGAGEVAVRDVAHDVLFARLADERNAVRVTTADGRKFIGAGRGAGRRPTSESVWADLLDVRQAIRPAVPESR